MKVVKHMKILKTDSEDPKHCINAKQFAKFGGHW